MQGDFPVTTWIAALKREWLLYHLGDPRFRFMWDKPPPNEWVSLDCETTGLNTNSDDIISIGAVRIRGNRVMTSERLELLVRPDKKKFSAESVRVHRLREQDVAQGVDIDDAMMQLMRFIGSRPLVGYYLEFDIAMINRVLFPILGMGLPQPKIEVSGLYYDYKYRQLPTHARQNQGIDLRFDSLMQDLNLPLWPAHDALNDAVMAALAFVKLRHLAA
jgi:DNA polymerase-3 subunit epsilon